MRMYGRVKMEIYGQVISQEPDFIYCNFGTENVFV
jgi:hypothetical protein